MRSMKEQRGSGARGYAAAVAVTAVAILLTVALADLLAASRFLLLWVAILVSAVVWGVGPALVSVAIAVCAAAYLLFNLGSWTVAPYDVIRIALFTAFAVALAFAVGRRREAQERADLLNHWLETTLRSIGDAVIATDARSVVMFMNRTAEKLTGWTSAEAEGRPLNEVLHLLHEITRERVFPSLTAVVDSSGSAGAVAQTVLVRRDGREVPVDLRSAPSRERDGSLTGIVLVFNDVTERRSLERSRSGVESELRDSERKYRTLVEATPVAQAIWTATPDGKITWADEWLRMTGQTREQVQSGAGMDVVHAEDVARTAERWETALSRGTLYEDELRVRMPDGRHRWFAIRAVPVRDRDDLVSGWVGVVADIHRRKRHDEEAAFMTRATDVLMASLEPERTLRTLAQLCVPELGDWCAIDLVIEGTSYVRVAVQHSDPAKVQMVFDLDEKYRARPETDPILDVMRNGRSHVMFEITDEFLVAAAIDDEHLELARSLGLRSWIVAPMLARGRIIGTLSVVTAESGRRYEDDDVRLVEELARRAAMAVDNARLYGEAGAANRAKDEFLATLSHELRTPLTAISGWAAMLKIGSLDDETKQLAVDTIASSARAQGELIDELLELSRVVAGKFELEIDTVDLARLCEELTIAARPAAEAKQIRLTSVVAERPLAMQGDERRLRQVLWNLITNAVKFTDTGGAVTIDASRHDETVQVRVSDTGLGIAPEFLPHVWERFRQADASATRAYGGLGLGLTVARQFVELHGGRIFATSEGLGHGATFTIELPVRAIATAGVPREP